MTFDVACDRLLGHEGGYVYDPQDPGGETHFGISKRSYPHVDIQALTRDGAKLIYQVDFWDRIQADTLPGSVAFQLFDFAVHAGIETAVRYLQRAIGVADDGQWGPVSAAAVASRPAAEILLRLNAERLDYYSGLSTWPTFGKGWARRVAQNLRYGAADT
jgi:lysozyme family protein